MYSLYVRLQGLKLYENVEDFGGIKYSFGVFLFISLFHVGTHGYFYFKLFLLTEPRTMKIEISTEEAGAIKK